MRQLFQASHVARFSDGFANIGWRWKQKIVRAQRNARKQQIADAFGQVETCYARAREKLVDAMREQAGVRAQASAKTGKEKLIQEYAGSGLGGQNLFGKDFYPLSARQTLCTAPSSCTDINERTALFLQETQAAHERIDARMLALQNYAVAKVVSEMSRRDTTHIRKYKLVQSRWIVYINFFWKKVFFAVFRNL
ncbi:unnamed protein product [Amoebophrya sp. A120]|nr:unnamed protein product [Amoebophrya sp. A120]|eukprot:GSA120T00021259001.1